MSTDSVVIEFPRRHRMFHEERNPALGAAICLMVCLGFWPLVIFGTLSLVHMSRLVLA